MKVEISEETALVLKKMLSTSIDKKRWIRDNKDIKNPEELQAKIDKELKAYEELEEALAP